MDTISNPRSTLHSLEVRGRNTPNVESLTSYFCRLAYSHSMTSRNLAVWVLRHFNQPAPDNYKWFRRSFSGMSPESEQWAAWLAELTGVQQLDQLTLVPWRHLQANVSLVPQSDSWCPECFQEDLKAGHSPFLRLAWEIGSIRACADHEIELVAACPHCNQTNIRNRASTVVPGYCTACGEFLGTGKTTTATPEAIWVAQQVGLMLANAPQVTPEGVLPLLETIIERIAAGNVAAFAKKMGLSKSGVWYWINEGRHPTLQAWLAIALHGGIGLNQLFAGELQDWVLPTEPMQLSLPLLSSPRKGFRGRTLDWVNIRSKLHEFLSQPEPITLTEACERVGVDYKQITQHANQEARAIAAWYRRHQARVRQDREKQLRDRVMEVLQERLDAGYEGVSAREVLPRLDGDLRVLRNIYRHIGEVVAANG